MPIFQLMKESFSWIMGLSGSGKSTLLRCINRLIRPTAGQVLVNGVDISKISEKELLQVRRKELAMVFQNFGLLPHRSVLSNIAFGLELQGVKKEEREKKEKPLRNADNRIPFNFHGLLVNQKASYMFTAPPLFNLGNKNANKALVKFLGDKYPKICKDLCIEASNCTVGWLHVWHDEKGTWKYAVVPAEQVIPVWSDNLEKELLGVFRSYPNIDEETGDTYIIL